MRVYSTMRWAVVAAVIAVGMNGCKPDTKPTDTATPNTTPAAATSTPAPVATAADPATTGTVTGVVHLTGTPPAPVKIDMSMDPVCSMMGGDNYSEQYVASGGKLANVFVYVKSGPAAAMNANPGLAGDNGIHTVLDQKGCRYIPHVVAIAKGGTVEFRNSDSTMHNVHTMPVVAGNETVDVSQAPHGAPQTHQFIAPEIMMPVRCNNHPWMNAFINISATPFFAVTGKDGSFKITGLPPGDYVLGFAQEKLGEQTAKVTVSAKGTAKTEATFAMK
jgi:plastocyanin